MSEKKHADDELACIHVCLVADIGEYVERTAHPGSLRRLHAVHVLRC